jgi:DNA-binding Lrp family transcriptional regulator
MVNLNLLQRKILFQIEADGNLSVAEIAKKLGEREHVIRNALTKMEQDGYFWRAVTVDHRRLGWSSICFNITLQSRDAKAHSSFISVLQASPRVTWVSEIGGEYQYEVTLLIREELEAVEFLNHLPQKAAISFAKKSSCIETIFSSFGSKYLIEGETLVQSPAIFNNTNEKVETDEVDHKILWSMCNLKYKNHEQVARATGMPTATFHYRLNKLLDLKIINEKVCLINHGLCGAQTYYIYLSLTGASKDIVTRMEKFCRQHPSVSHLIRSLGNYDYQLICQKLGTPNPSDLVRELDQEFSKDIVDVRVVPQFTIYKQKNFPFLEDWLKRDQLFGG